MAVGYKTEPVLLKGAIQTLGASVTARAVSNPFKITYEGSRNLRVDVVVDSATAGSGVTVVLQDAPFRSDVATDWQTKKSATVSTTASRTIVSITINVEVTGDQTYCPLRPHGRIVATTGAGDALVISDIRVMQGI